MGSLGGFYEVPMGSLWVSMGPSGSLWVPMGSLWIPKGLYGCLGVSMGVYEGYGSLWGPYGVPMGLPTDPAPPMTSQNGDAAQRSWAAAILGEAGAHLERGVASELLPLIGPALARSSAHDPDPEVRSNALCSIGRLAANGVALGAYPWRKAPPPVLKPRPLTPTALSQPCIRPQLALNHPNDVRIGPR